MEEKKKITKKQIVTMSIGVSILIVLAITATYAFFRFGNSNAFGTTKLTGQTPDSDASSVVLENVNTTLTLGLETTDMLQANGNTTYWASPEGKKTSETINQIGKAKAMVEGTYTCNYTMTIEDKATSETSLYNAFQGMSTKSNNQIVLKVNEETYDFNTSNLFPITYNGILEGITQSDYQYITSSMYIKNELNIDQTPLSNKDIDIEFKVTDLNCVDESLLPEIKTFAIGEEGLTGKVYSNNPTIYLKFNNDNIEQYCISDSNKSSSCIWTNTNNEKEIATIYPISGNVGDSITLYAFIKDNLGNISKTSNTVTITAPIGNAANYIISLADQTGTNVITQTHDSTVQTGTNQSKDYRYIGNGLCLYDNGNYIGGEYNNTCQALYNYTRTIISDGTATNYTFQAKCPSNDSTYTYECTATFEGIKINDNGPSNYVCLGNLQSNGQCIDEDHLYRIIGVMPTQTTKSGSYESRVKLIKYTEYLDDNKVNNLYSVLLNKYGYNWTGQKESGEINYTSYSGANSNPTNWEESTLNRVILNQTYYNSLEEKYKNMIGNSVWYLGANDCASIPLSTMYTAERSETICSISNSCQSANETNPTYAERKIGLMYPSDYGYATSGGSITNRTTCLTTSLSSWNGSSVTDCKNNDWLFMDGYYQWTITPRFNSISSSFTIQNNGRASCATSVYGNPSVIRPSFYLNSNVNIISGNGSISSPYTLG